jgi:thioester reductase-like protein
MCRSFFLAFIKVDFIPQICYTKNTVLVREGFSAAIKRLTIVAYFVILYAYTQTKRYNKMKNAIEETVMIEKLKNPEMQMIDLFEVLQEDIQFAKSLNDNLGDSKEEKTVSGLVRNKLNNKAEFIGQMLQHADFYEGKLDMSDYNIMQRHYDIKVLITPKVDK